jgi:hypothetical protein
VSTKRAQKFLNEIHSFCYSTNIIRVIKKELPYGNCNMHGYMRNVFKFLSETVKGRGLGLERRLILKWILKKWGLRICTGLNWLKNRVYSRAVTSTAMDFEIP